MADADLADLVRRSLAESTRASFEERVEEQAARLRAEIRAGRFDNRGFSVGLELEAYVVDEDGRVARVPDAVFETSGCAEELGLHNVEINTPPAAFDADGLAAQVDSVRDRVDAVRRALDGAGLELVLDGMWTVPPAQGTADYLGDVDRLDGVTVATNMRRSPRYCAIDNDVLGRAGGAVELALPGVRCAFPTILVESLTTSIQPHLQVPDPETFPTHYAVAIRTLGPVLALATNSPFLPADLYDGGTSGDEGTEGERGGRASAGASGTGERVDDPYALVERTFHELRVPVFEQAINAGDGDPKVRFPEEIDHATGVIDRLVDDRTCAPFLKEWIKPADAVDAYADRIWELDHKRGTYWRWLRAVAGGEAVDGVGQRSLRLEYRPLPTQPSVADIAGLQCLVSGLVRGLVAADHPLGSLEWEAARRCFYDVVEAGLDADLAWVDADGDRADDPAVVYDEVFAYARRGLREQDVPADRIDDYLAPIEARWTDRTTPSRWKKRTVRERLDRGADLGTAIEEMQLAYIERSRTGEPFAEW